MIPLIYVAHPYSAPSLYLKSVNVERARFFTRIVAQLGGAPICPVTMCAYMDGDDVPETRWLEYDLLLLTKCDAVYMTDDWEHSSGCMTEYHWAVAHSIQVLQTMDQLREFIEIQAALDDDDCFDDDDSE